MSRSYVVLKNMIWEIGYYAAVLLLGFLAPRYIISIYGSDVNGLTASINEILNVMLLVQAGATTAAVYELFKPISNKDFEKVAILLSNDCAFFNRISILFLAGTLPVAIVSSFAIKSDLQPLSVFVAFCFMGMKSFIDLRFTSKYRVVFTSFQKKFVLSIATLAEQVLYYSMVFVSLYFRWPFLTIYFWFFAGCILKIVILRLRYKKEFGDLLPDYRGTVDGKIPNRGYSLANEVSHSIVAASPAIIISFTCGLQETSVYSIYALVASALNLLTTAVYSAFGPSFGNYIAEKKTENANSIFAVFQYAYLSFSIVLCLGMFFLFLPFVSEYIENADISGYLNSQLALLVSVNFLASSLRVPYNIIVSSCGFFRETWRQPVASAIVSIVISCFAVQIDFSLVLLGPISFYFTNFLYQHIRLGQLTPLFVKNYVFGLLLVAVAGLVAVSCLIDGGVTPHTILGLILACPLSLLFASVYIFVASLLVAKQELRQTLAFCMRVMRHKEME